MGKSILIFALSRNPWIGGIYYKKNILHMLLSNPGIREKYRFVVLTNSKYRDVFSCFEKEKGSKVTIVTCSGKINPTRALLQVILCWLKYSVVYIFPIKPYRFLKLLGITPVSWIADFQHNHYPEFFEQAEISKRNADFGFIARSDNPLILSSEDALEDFRKYYSSKRENVHVVHFTSFIQDELQRMNALDHGAVLEKYGLRENTYAVVCNQFWQHKNHKLVLEALKALETSHPDFCYTIVMTGEPNDRRNPGYIDEIKKLVEDPWVSEHTKILGFIDRIEQLCIISNAGFVVQPSLFEGWGTVLEDAKVLGKKVLLSDIPVHREQMDENCTLFSVESCRPLAELIFDESKKTHQAVHLLDKTEEYSKELARVFV